MGRPHTTHGNGNGGGRERMKARRGGDRSGDGAGRGTGGVGTRREQGREREEGRDRRRERERELRRNGGSRRALESATSGKTHIRRPGTAIPRAASSTLYTVGRRWHLQVASSFSGARPDACPTVWYRGEKSVPGTRRRKR